MGYEHSSPNLRRNLRRNLCRKLSPQTGLAGGTPPPSASNRPSQFRRGGPWVCTTFLGPRHHHLAIHKRVDPFPLSLAKRLLHPSIFARMEGQHRYPPSRFHTRRQLSQPGVQRTELIVHFNSQCLKHPPHGIRWILTIPRLLRIPRARTTSKCSSATMNPMHSAAPQRQG